MKLKFFEKLRWKPKELVVSLKKKGNRTLHRTVIVHTVTTRTTYIVETGAVDRGNFIAILLNHFLNNLRVGMSVQSEFEVISDSVKTDLPPEYSSLVQKIIGRKVKVTDYEQQTLDNLIKEQVYEDSGS